MAPNRPTLVLLLLLLLLLVLAEYMFRLVSSTASTHAHPLKLAAVGSPRNLNVRDRKNLAHRNCSSSKDLVQHY